MKSIDAKTAKEWLEKNEAIIIDVREPEEYRAIHISEAHLIPLGKIDENKMPNVANKKIIIHCKLGSRGKTACEKLLAENPKLDIYNMEGGITAWESAGFKVEKDNQAPLSIDRQVQITIGGGVILGLILGYFVSTIFLLLSAFLGAGLLFAGITGSCRLALLITKMPWNKKEK